MRNKIIAIMCSIVILIIAIGCLNTASASRPTGTPPANLESKKQLYKHWSISKLSDSLLQLGSNQLTFMEENSMKATYIEVNKGESFYRKSATDDLYYLHSGDCIASISTSDQAFNNGDVVFVKKGAVLSINYSDQDLQIVMVSMTQASSTKKDTWKHFSKSDIESPRATEENAWNPFVMHSNVMLGMYMLPYSFGGDGRLVHEWQELNIVTSGSSKFVMDTGTIDVGKGSIFFVEEGNGHYFDRLKEDIDILILWEQRNVSHEGH